MRVRRQAFVEHLLGAIEALPVTTAVARTHAGIWAGLEREGRAIGAHDLWIAATALAMGLALTTANAAEFERVPGLEVIGV